MAADLNHDGAADLTTINEASTDLRTFLNLANGSGLFQEPFLDPPVGLPTAASPNEPADFDNDGNTDICLSAYSGHVFVALGKGDGTFAAPQSLPVGVHPRGIAVLDVDGDADLDIVNANFLANNLTLLINDGSGAFGAPTSFNSGLSAE